MYSSWYLEKLNFNFNYSIIRYNYSINRYNYEINSIDDTTIILTSTPIMTFISNAIAYILTFKLTIRYNYYLNSNGSTTTRLNSNVIEVQLDNY